MEWKFGEFNEFSDSDKLLKHWGQFKDPICHLYLPGCVVTSWSLPQEFAGCNTTFVLPLNSANPVKKFRKNSIVRE